MVNRKKREGEPEREHLTRKNLIKIGFHIWRQFDDTYYTGFAAQIAYFFFMASIPTLIVLSQLLGFFNMSLDIILHWLNKNIDSRMSKFVLGLFSASNVRMSNILLIIVAVWAASSLEFSLARLSSHVLTSGTYRFNFWSERIKAIPTSLLTIATVAFSLVVYVYGEELTSRVFKDMIIAKALVALRTPLVAVLYFVMILVNYYILPRIKVPLKSVLPGAIFASIGIMIVTVIYGIYIGYIADYNIIYGAFANIISLMFWFYLISWVLCIGMMFNKAWDEVMKRDLLTHDKMVEYLKAQLGDDSADYSRFFVSEGDKFDPETETIAVKMSRKYVEGYEEELQKEEEEMNRRRL
jgi:membrane protein